MFLSSKRGYTRSGEQFAHGYFLILMVLEAPKDATIGEWSAHNRENRTKVRGLVRYVRMRQCGHFMMASVRVRGHEITLSGTYGADGLLRDVPKEVFDLGTELPAELYEAWAKGGGHNSAGSEASAMHAWALTLPRPGKAIPKTRAA